MVRVRGTCAALALAVIVMGVSGCGSGTKAPADQVRAFFGALQTGDAKACDSLVPDERPKCESDWDQMGLRSQDFDIHQTVVNGDQALVSVTGTSCTVAGCRTVTDSASGMPTDTVSFDQAWKALTAQSQGPESSTPAAVRLVKVNDTWFIQP